MNEDRLDGWLSRLPHEPATPDLAARIILAVAVRRQARRLWLRVGLGSGACGLAGLALLAVSWAEAAQVTGALWGTLDVAGLTQALVALLGDPLNTFVQWFNSGLFWQESLAEGVGVALTVGAALLAAGAFGGLARMLRPGMPLAGNGGPAASV